MPFNELSNDSLQEVKSRNNKANGMWVSHVYRDGSLGAMFMGTNSEVLCNRDDALQQDGKTKDDIMCVIVYYPNPRDFFLPTIIGCPFRRAIEKDEKTRQMMTYRKNNWTYIKTIIFEPKRAWNDFVKANPDAKKQKVIGDLRKARDGDVELLDGYDWKGFQTLMMDRCVITTVVL